MNAAARGLAYRTPTPAEFERLEALGLGPAQKARLIALGARRDHDIVRLEQPAGHDQVAAAGGKPAVVNIYGQAADVDPGLLARFDQALNRPFGPEQLFGRGEVIGHLNLSFVLRSGDDAESSAGATSLTTERPEALRPEAGQ